MTELQSRARKHLNKIWAAIESGIYPSSAKHSATLTELVRRFGHPLPWPLRLEHAKYAPTLDTMDRWVTIEYPKAAVEATGAYGIAIKTSDVLRWSECEGELGEYLGALAETLDATDTERPNVLHSIERHREALRQILDFLDFVDASGASLDQESLSTLYFAIRTAYLAVEDGFQQAHVGVSYPVDRLPVDESSGFGTPTGLVLRHALEKAADISASEREQLGVAILFHPDEELEVDVVIDGRPHVVADPNVFSPVPDILGPAIGSVLLDHYGGGSEFSSDPEKFEFKLHLPAEGDEDFADCCFLVSDVVSYVAVCENADC